MKNYDLETYLKANTVFVVPITLALLIIIFGSIGMYLAEHKHVGANITRLGDAIWFTVATIATVGYGDYYPITLAGRLIAILVMFSGIGIVVTLVGLFSQRRLQHVESRLMPKSKSPIHSIR
jgi:voltage-gated potassium channel